jgi:dipeptidyl aminopeptidase/acylaminoacyl peptidase
LVARWIGAAFFLTAVFAIGGAGDALPAASADTSGAVVFQSDRDGDLELYAVNVDGTALTQLTHNDVDDSSPLPSPDGKRIAFYRSAVGLAVIDVEGTGLRALRGCTIAASWSPDSSHLACTTSGGVGISVADIASGNVVRLVQRGSDPSWSPDGRTIAYVDAGVWVVQADGGVPRRVTNRILDSPPSWSPDSRRLAYIGSATGSGPYDLFTIGVDGAGERRLVRDVDSTESSQWSPRGSPIAFAKSVAHGPSDAIYVVRPDGTGLRRVGPSAGGESSRELSWSSDGALLLFARNRFKFSLEADVVLSAGGTGPPRAVTEPFPSGGSNNEPRWLAGASLTAVPRSRPRMIALPPARTLLLPASAAALSIEPLAADGARAAVAYATCRGLVWEPLARRTTRLPRLCLGQDTGEIVVAGTRVAWISYSNGNTEAHTELDVARIGAKRPTYVAAASALTSDGHSTYDSGAVLHHLRGGGGTIAFTSSRFGGGESRSSWVLLANRTANCPSSGDWKHLRICRRLAAGGGVTATVDAGRVVTIAAGGIVRLLTTGGAALREWSLGPGISEARLTGRKLVVQRGASLLLFDTTTGASTGTWTLARDGGQPPALLDVHAELAAYTTGGAIHVLRLSDGRDLAIRLPRAAPPFSAQLESSGLFVWWNRMYDRKPSRLTFVARHALESAVARGG